ncbi:gamma-glutamylcyclotransferase family protein [Mangrovicella endophytica]|uniref:gamma-glutamylcyclotransferase family protein n=1 Tax=Mangrovicella endophytica TaxID=2066697 RepID=UPI000C9E7CAB|nr:gamma-glutamylcyclotransferase family protein [Mangrovicella endophytica]
MLNVFVYGTLKRGFPFYEQGLAGARFLGTAQTVEPYPMLIAGDIYGPVMLDRPGEGLRVHGELYDVDEADMPTLDALEGVGSPGSFRSTLLVEGDLGRVEAVGFMKAENWLDPIHAGPIDDYQDRRFIPPWERD